MNRFDRRWQECMRVARRVSASPEAPLEAPAGGWLRHGNRRGAERDDVVAWWGWYGARGVAVAAVVLAMCLLALARDRSDRPSLRPGVEDAVAEVLWRL